MRENAWEHSGHSCGFVETVLISLLVVVGCFAFRLSAAETAHSTTNAPIHWQHPAGFVTKETLTEIKSKLASEDWAKRVYANRKQALQPWLDISSAKLREVFPKHRGNVYHNFSCPQDRCRLNFNPLESGDFKCPICSKTFPPETDAGIYPAKDRYHGTMYDGWICLFHLTASDALAGMGVLSHTESANAPAYASRTIELLMIYAEVLPQLTTKFDNDRQMSVLLTYHREGDNKILNDLAIAYELVRDRMTPDQRARFEQNVLRRMLDDLMLERIYTYNHNNVYQWHRTILQVALALEREELIDWSYGFAKWSPESEPDHHSIRKILATHFKPDGAYWEMCSGYHLYPLNALCELAVTSRNLARMDAARWPATNYDLTDPTNPGHQVIRNALHWFMSLAPPDRVMPTIGDSMAPRAGMADYFATAETGYRFFGLSAVGDYPQLREGKRVWDALLYGAPRIEQSPEPMTSSFLSSGWVSLRSEWLGNKTWIGLNGLIPGGGHQHADRLTLLSHSQGQLLALEKATPYNESVTRVLGTLSQSHNTVTVDQQSQKQGEALKGDQIPRVTQFFTSRLAQFAELNADHLYPQTRIYRRAVAVIEDFYVDCFHVEGGTNFDWMFHHAGWVQSLGLSMEKGIFTPSEWLANGSEIVLRGTAISPWDVLWKVAEVTSRLTMLGNEPTTVFSVKTFPVDNAVVTPRNPACPTLCVRRERAGRFVAVGDAWRTEPNLQSVTASADGMGLVLRSKSNTYHVLLGPGRAEFTDGFTMSSDANFALVQNTNAVMLIHGSKFTLQSSTGELKVQLDQPANLAAEFENGAIVKKISGDIEYDTYGGVDHARPVPDVKVDFSGRLWSPATKP